MAILLRAALPGQRRPESAGCGAGQAVTGGAMFADLVLEGGGVKGIALVGAISLLEERGYEFQRVAGTSAGAIVGSLVAANARAAELEVIMRGVEYRRFQDGPRWRSLLLGKAVAVLFEQGIYEGEFVKDWLGERLARLGVHTFADLRYPDPERPPDPDHAYRLVVMNCDISQGCLRRLPWDYGHYGLAHSDQRVVDAVRASTFIPFFYKPARLTDAHGSDRWLVDGAMLSRFPIDAFDAPSGLGGILYSDWVTTVSPNHAGEALYDDGASGLGRTLKEHQDSSAGFSTASTTAHGTQRPTRSCRSVTRSTASSASTRTPRRSGTGSGCARPTALSSRMWAGWMSRRACTWSITPCSTPWPAAASSS